MDGRLTVEAGHAARLSRHRPRQSAPRAAPERVRACSTLVPEGLQAGLRTHNPVGAARRKVSHHYDLKPELFDLFLDSDRQYSCAYFASDNDDIETAQRRKKAHLAAKLLLRPGDRVLDIGSGWGGLGPLPGGAGGCECDGRDPEPRAA